MENLCATFTQFGASHIVLMFIAIAMAVTLVFVLRKFEDKQRNYAEWVMLGIMGGFILVDFICQIGTGGEFIESLPLSPSHVFAYICLFVKLKDSSSWIKFGYFITTPLSALALFVVPSYLMNFSAWSLGVIGYFVILGILIAYSILELMWSGEYLSKTDILGSFLNYIIVISFIHILNVILRFTPIGVHANYFGTMGEEYDAINKLLYSFIEVPFVHQLPFFAVIVGLGFLLIIPFDILKTKKDRKAQMEELVALGNLKAQQNFRKNKNSGSQVLVNSAEKAKPAVEKDVKHRGSSGFVAVNKEVKVNKDFVDKK